jgi:hypothetical protein
MFTIKKNILRNTLPNLRPDLESQANFGLEQPSKIFKNLQKHILASSVNQGCSTVLNLPADLGGWVQIQQAPRVRFLQLVTPKPVLFFFPIFQFF